MASTWNKFYRGYVEEPSLVEVGDGIYAYLHHDGSWGLNNSGFVHSGHELAVIDTALTEDRTRLFREAMTRRSGVEKPQVLINTHHHSDHTFGNSVFDDACIVAHRLCRDAVVKQGLKPTDQDPIVPWGSLKVRPPQLLFDEKLELYVGDHRAELIFVGPAHTSNDIVVWLPEERVLFAGDVLFHDATPITHGGSTAGSVRALNTMKALDPRVIVPGHGTVCGPEVLDQWLGYFSFVTDTAAKTLDASLSVLDAARQQDLGEYAEWQHPERFVLNLHRAYEELKNGPEAAFVDEAAAFDDMLRLNPSSYGHRIIKDREAYVDPCSSIERGDAPVRAPEA